MADDSYVDGSYFFYAPNKGAPFFFAIAFAGSAMLHFWQCYHYKFFKVTGLFPFCCLLFTAGFAVRIYSAWNYDNLDTFIAPVCLVYAAPPLLVQVFVVACFVVLAATFQRRCARAGVSCRRGIRSPLVTLYVSAGLILARTAFRIVEYFGVAAMRRGPDADAGEVPPAMRYEWFFYVFEAGLMLADVVMFNARHPRRYLPERYTVYLARDGGTEVDGPGWKDPRPVWVTVADPFDLAGVFRGRDRRPEPFWEGDVGQAGGGGPRRKKSKGSQAV